MEFVIYCERRKSPPQAQKTIIAGYLTAVSREEAIYEFTTGKEFQKWQFLACEPRSDFMAAQAQHPQLSEDEFILMRYQTITAVVTSKQSDKPAKRKPALPVEVWNEKPVDAELAWQTTKVLCSGGHF